MLSKGQYKPQSEEAEILKYWLENNFYSPDFTSEQEFSTASISDRENFCIVLPPPNANGNLHLGHMSGYAYQDLMGRYQRMRGKRVLLLPGKDHAGIQTEVVFERELEQQGKKKQEIGREQFYKMCYDFCMENSRYAREQEQKIGLSADYNRELFTLDPKIVSEVLKAFELMYQDELIYRGKRLINWCVRCQSALADIDTEFKDSETNFVYFKYAFTEPDKNAIAIKNQFQGKTVTWNYLGNQNRQGEETPFLIGETSEFELNGEKLKVFLLGGNAENYEPGKEYTSKAIGILMKLNGNLRLVTIPEDFTGDLEHELEKTFMFEIRRTAGPHIILFDQYPDDKYYTNGFILGTVRPETKFGDTALAVDPDDDRYKEYVGKTFEVQTMNGTAEIKVIADNAVEEEFGTGMIKVTPAHAPEDWDIAQRHKQDTLPERQVIGFDGKLNHLTGKYQGMSIKEARTELIEDMKQTGMLVHLDTKYKNRIRICERCKHPIEPLVAYQWFVDTQPLKQKAKDLVNQGFTEIMPEGKKKTYLQWMDTPEDWCITRQLWWGYRLPVWYRKSKEQFISETGEVKEKVAGRVMESTDDYEGNIYVGLGNPNGNLFLIPGKYAYANREFYPNIQIQYPFAKVLKLANKSNPSYQDYVTSFEQEDFDEKATLVAHSLGARAILKYLLEKNIRVKNLILLAPAVNCRAKDKSSNYADLFGNEAEYAKLRDKVDNLYLIHSDTDELASFDDFLDFANHFTNLQRIFEKDKGHFISGEYTHSSEELMKILSQTTKQGEWIQDEDILDTWFSSGQWPYVTLNSRASDYEHFYPTQVMETGWDILLFWVTRMMLLDPYRAEKHGATTPETQTPFKNVYLHGLVLDKNGVKMSKSKGNGIDPFEMMQKYGTDALRFSFVIDNAAGQNYRLYEEKIAGNRNFCNKIWNASKFALFNLEEAPNLAELDSSDLPLTEDDKHMLEHMQNLITETTRRIDSFQFGIAASELYSSFWHTFADIYIEQVKSRLYTKDKEGNPINTTEPEQKSRLTAQWMIFYCLETYLKLLHPFMPFITERIWQELPKKNGEAETLMYSQWPKGEKSV